MNAWRVVISLSSCTWHLFRHLQTKVAVYDRHYRGLGERDLSGSVSDMSNSGFVAGLLAQLFQRSHTLQCMHTSDYHCHVFSRCFTFFAAYSVICRALPLPSPGFTLQQKIQLVACAKMCSKHKTAPKIQVLNHCT